ncbi:CPBP family intramembrane glutamic endopeptidase [Muriicola sp. Z0-33]|uniref:CPBP family intramembrane glutamic endopeptidase n=1 Tax=Muriicola sp. Z0-33 TaxID=2816957 RepID=UPI0022380BC8|nr:CPBP family intramembrane glutamic endopeptidase [Muriicola sp. Z0-33]MCW5516609.1 CPBP family intramembrane metalloprotease [Muriicola sp. Z0-33]
MYIEQGFKALHEGWRYLVGFLFVLIGWQFIGAIPLLAILVAKSVKSGSMPSDLGGMSDLLGSNLFLFLMLLTFVVALFVLFLTVKFLHKQDWKTLTTARKKTDWKRIFFAFGLWSVVSIIFIGIDIALSPQNYEWNFQLLPFLTLFVIAVIFIPLQTSFEEYFMRGYLMQGIGVAVGNRWVPLLFTSFLFGILHILNPEVEKLGYGIMVFYMGTGLFLGILTLMDKGLELALGFHAANNLTAALLVTADWTAFQTHSVYRDISEPALGWDVFLPVLVIYPILLLIMARKYGWSNWKERLTGKVLKVEAIAESDSNERLIE